MTGAAILAEVEALGTEQMRKQNPIWINEMVKRQG